MGDEGAEEAHGEPLVGVIVGRGDVVEDPKDWLGESGIVGFDGVGTVNEELLYAPRGVDQVVVGAATRKGGGGGEAQPWLGEVKWVGCGGGGGCDEVQAEA